jgi:hypothetical protein
MRPAAVLQYIIHCGDRLDTKFRVAFEKREWSICFALYAVG